MRISIDFSIFCGPDDAFGMVTGEIEVSKVPAIGDVIEIHPMAGHQKITGINQADDFAPTDTILLQDLVCATAIDAEKIGSLLESEVGLFYIRYEEI